MDKTSEFVEFLSRLRAGDARAAAELVRRYESAIRVAVRVRLTDPAVKRLLDSMDICQSVLASFFVRAVAGQFDLSEPAQLVALLVRMAQNKLAYQVRHHHAQRRDCRAALPDGEVGELAAPEPGPERLAEGRDLLAALNARLSEEERALVACRAAGHTWPEIAAELGGTAQARRRQLSRALDRVAPDLGLDELGDLDD
jgi:RNA polymerase sigma-70 factor (ECF subfamily)